MLTAFLSIMLRGEMFSILRMHDLTTIGADYGRRARRPEARLILAMYEAKQSSPSPTKEINGDA